MVQFRVEDMSCGHCASSITKAVKDIDPNATVNIDLSAKTVSVEGASSEGQIEQAIEDAGFTPKKQ